MDMCQWACVNGHVSMDMCQACAVYIGTCSNIAAKVDNVLCWSPFKVVTLHIHHVVVS